MSPTEYDAWQSIETRLGRFEDKIDRLVLTMTQAIQTTYEPLDIRVRTVTEKVATFEGVAETVRAMQSDMGELKQEMAETRGVKKSREIFLPVALSSGVAGVIAVIDIIFR